MSYTRLNPDYSPEIARKLGLTTNSNVFYARYYVTQGGEHRIYFYTTKGGGGQLGWITLSQ